MVSRCLLISGLSGSGKTTIGKQLSQLKGWNFIDGDDFFIPKDQMSQVKLSNGDWVANWDSPNSIDWAKLNRVVKQQLLNNNVVLVTFLPMTEMYEFNVNYHVRLLTGRDAIKKCIDARKVSKKIVTLEKASKDELVILEYVIPMYADMCARSVDQEIHVYQSDGESSVRRDVRDILNDIIDIF